MSATQSLPALARGYACLECRHRKSRCDAAKPICTPCRENRRRCEYKDPPLSRIQQLLNTIRDLEAQVTALREQKHHPLPAVPKPTPPTLGSQNKMLGVPAIPAPGGLLPINPEGVAAPFIGELTPQQRESFIQAFLANRDKCCFDMSIDRFRHGLSMSPDDSRAPSRVLVHAILLLGCYFTRSPYQSRYEPYLLQMVDDELFQIHETPSLYSPYIYHDFIRASNLVAFFLCYKGCYREAQSMASQAARVAKDCELHQISMVVARNGSPSENDQRLLPLPRDNIELGERIHTWWQTFTLDKLLSQICGFPSSLSNGLDSNPRERITTPWPRLMSEYEMGHLSEAENTSVGHLYTTYTPSPYARRQTLTGLRAQGMSLIAQATQVCRNYPPNMNELRAVDSAAARFIASLPDLRAGGESGEQGGQAGISPINPRLVMIHTMAHATLLILHQHGIDQFSRHRFAAATQSIVSIISQLRDSDYLEMFIGLGHIWYMCGEVLLKVYKSSQGSIREAAARELQAVMQGMRKLSFTYIFLGLRLQTLEGHL